MEYEVRAESFRLEINENVYQRFSAYIENYNYNVESGGILVGILDPSHNSIIITDITEPFDRDRQTRYGFHRMEKGHQEKMDQLWEQSDFNKTYLGEWHTHKQKRPCPSNIDIKNWIKISRKNIHNSQRLFFIIVGTEEIGVWMVVHDMVKKLEVVKN